MISAEEFQQRLAALVKAEDELKAPAASIGAALGATGFLGGKSGSVIIDEYAFTQQDQPDPS